MHINGQNVNAIEKGGRGLSFWVDAVAVAAAARLLLNDAQNREGLRFRTTNTSNLHKSGMALWL